MTREELQLIIASEPYNFLRTNPHLGKQVMFLTIGGSHAYGTNVEGSDVDIRGVALNTEHELLGMDTFDHWVDETTDTTVFSFNKAVKLMMVIHIREGCTHLPLLLSRFRKMKKLSKLKQHIRFIRLKKSRRTKLWLYIT